MSKSEDRFSFTWGMGKLGDMGFVPLYAFMLRTYAGLGLSRQEMLCIIHLASYHYNSPGGESRPSLGRVAQQMGYAHKQRLYELVAGLEEKGMLVVTRRPGSTSIYNAHPFAKAAYKLWFELQAAEGGTLESTTPEQGGTLQSTPKSLRGTPQSTGVVLSRVPEEYKQEAEKEGQEEESFPSFLEQEEQAATWQAILDELALQMTGATFDTWIRGSKVKRAENGLWTIELRSVFAVEWVDKRLRPVIERTVARHAEGVRLDFVAKGA